MGYGQRVWVPFKKSWAYIIKQHNPSAWCSQGLAYEFTYNESMEPMNTKYPVWDYIFNLYPVIIDFSHGI